MEILANNITVAITAADIAVFKIAYIPITSTTIASMKLHIGIVADATAPNIADDLPIYSGVTFFIYLNRFLTYFFACSAAFIFCFFVKQMQPFSGLESIVSQWQFIDFNEQICTVNIYDI